MPFFLFPLLPLAAQERMDGLYEGCTDSICAFRFVAEKDMFFIPYADNLPRLERLSAVVRQHHEAIMDGKIPVFVDGYCNSLPGEADNLSVARLRSNRVKTELILHAGLMEKCFITRNHAGKGDWVTVRIYVPSDTSGTPSDTPSGTPSDTLSNALSERVGNASEHIGNASSDLQSDIPGYQDFQSAFSLRLNLFRWATLTPDLGLEWRPTRYLGILVNGSWTSWSWSDKGKRYALWKFSPELRYYIGKKNRGFLGAMYHLGDFNYKFGTTGKQGDYRGGGITGGYLLELNKILSLDFHAAFGYTHAGYDQYQLTGGIRVKQGHETKNYWGINQLGITVIIKR